MTFIIGAACVDVTDKSCIEVCPVDCIYEGVRKMYINPAECIDCGACEPECPVEAIVAERRLTDENKVFLADSIGFFESVLPGRSEPIRSPGGAAKTGVIGVDTELVAAMKPGG